MLPSLQAGAACTNRICPKSETEGAWDAELSAFREADHLNFNLPTFQLSRDCRNWVPHNSDPTSAWNRLKSFEYVGNDEMLNGYEWLPIMVMGHWGRNTSLFCTEHDQSWVSMSLISWSWLFICLPLLVDDPFFCHRLQFVGWITCFALNFKHHIFVFFWHFLVGYVPPFCRESARQSSVAGTAGRQMSALRGIS